MNFVINSGLPLFDGHYELDPDRRPFNTHELGWIKRLTGYLPQEIDARASGDPELIIALAAIAVTRAGKAEIGKMQQTYDALASLPFDGETVSASEDEEAEELPPTSETSSNGSSVSSGLVSTPSSETSPPTPAVSGMPGSATSPSAPPRSGN